MGIWWIGIEALAVLVDGVTKVYFLNSRFDSKYNSVFPQLIACLCLVAWGSVATFLGFHTVLYESVIYSILLAYLFLAKHGPTVQKFICTALAFAVVAGSSLTGAYLASVISGVGIKHTALYQDSSRILAIVFIKCIQIILFYSMSKRKHTNQLLSKKPLIVLSCMSTLICLCFLSLFSSISEQDEQINHVIFLFASSFLLVLIGVFAMYELFLREASRNADLLISLQRIKMETSFHKDIEGMYANLRTWQHEYGNNLIALRALAEEGEIVKVVEYLDNVSIKSRADDVLFKTGNLVLDAVASSKLSLARSCGIEVDVQTVYMQNDAIEDSDLCAIVGNLLDNAIEACERISSPDRTRFISLSLLIRGKNFALSVTNSYEGKIEQNGGEFITAKDKRLNGNGIQYIDSIVGKYRGHVLRKYQDGIFETHILLPLLKPKNAE